MKKFMKYAGLFLAGVIMFALAAVPFVVYGQDEPVTLNGVEWSEIEEVINPDYVVPETITLTDHTVLSVIEDGHRLSSDNGTDTGSHRFTGRILDLVVSAVNDSHILVIHENGGAEITVADGDYSIDSEFDGFIVLNTAPGCAVVYIPPAETGAYVAKIDGYVVAEGTVLAHNDACTASIHYSAVNAEYEAVDGLYRAQRIANESTVTSTPTVNPTPEATPESTPSN